MRPKHRKILRLRQLRKSRDWTLKHAAARAGLHINTYSAIELGKTTPSLDNAKTIAALYDKPVEEVFGYVEVPS